MKRVRRTGLQGWTVALVLHGVLLSWLLAGDPPRPRAKLKRPPVKVKLVRRPPPAPEPEPPAQVAEPPAPAVEPPQPEPPAPPPPKNRVVRREPPAPKPVEQPEAKPAAEPRAEPPPPAPPRPARFSVDLEATVPAGGVAVPASPGGSGSAFSAPGGSGRPGSRGPVPAGKPRSGGATSASGALAVDEVTTLPRLLSQPSASEMRKLYPADARQRGLEGNVKLKILVSDEGRVLAVRILRSAGNGFDEVARKLVRRFRFRAGTRNGRPVAVWIPWTYKFRLSG
jgi:protein TonB